MGDDERARRVGLNEAVFREVNERIEELTRRFGDTETMAIVCECGDQGCTLQLPVSPETYARVRSDPSLFLIAEGHAIDGVEDVVDSPANGVQVVRKRPGLPLQVAELTDPRS